MSETNPFAAPKALPEFAIERPGHYRAELASRGARFGAAVLDSMVLLLVAGPLLVGLFIAVEMTNLPFSVTEDSFADNFFVSLATFIVGNTIDLLINGYFWETRGQSLGKMALGIRIVDRDTEMLLPLSRLFFRRVLLVRLLDFIPVIGSLLQLVDPLLIFRDTRACLHDEWAGTKVIRVSDPVVEQPRS